MTRNKNVLKAIGSGIGYILFGVALWVIYRQIHMVGWQAVLTELQELHLFSIVIAFLCLVCNYIVLSSYDALSFRIIGRVLSYKRIALGSFIGEAFTIGMNVVMGTSMRYRIYARWGITLHEVTEISFFSFAAFSLGFLMLAGIIFPLVPLVAPPELGLPALPLRAVGFISLLLVLLYLACTAYNQKNIVIGKWTLRPLPESLACYQVLLSTVQWLLSSGCLYFLLPPDHVVPYPVFLGAFLVSLLFGQISQSPAGLGVFEATMLVMLASFLPTESLLGSLIVYRVLYYIFPLFIAGILLLIHELHPKKHHHAGKD